MNNSRRPSYPENEWFFIGERYEYLLKIERFGLEKYREYEGKIGQERVKADGDLFEPNFA